MTTDISQEKPSSDESNSQYISNSTKSQTNLPKMYTSSLNFTSARFRMLANSEPQNIKYQCFIEDNLPHDQYSYWDIIMQFQTIASGGITKERLVLFISSRNKFRAEYFRKNFSLIKNVPQSCVIHSPRSSIKFTCLNKLWKPQVSIDQVVCWFPTFIKNEMNKVSILEVKEEKQLFEWNVLSNINKLLEEYYLMVDCYPHQLLSETIKYLVEKTETLSQSVLNYFESTQEICNICGTGFQSETDLDCHLEKSNCENNTIHRCQCNKTFDTHLEWTNHWLKCDMPCSVIAWHIWRNTAWENLENTFYRCDGCQTFFSGFLELWNHICYCPFFRVYLLANCQLCDDNMKTKLYYESSFQELMRAPYGDKVGIKILQEWSKLSTISFRVKLLTGDEKRLLENLHESRKAGK